MVEKLEGADDTEREDEIEAEGAEDKAPEATEKEKEARALGWVPEDEWDDERAEKSGRRKPSKFISADEFLQRQEDNPGMERERLRSATRKIDDLNKKLDEFGKVFDDQRRISREAQKRAYEKGLTDAQARWKEAVADGDVAKAEEVQGEIDQIKADKATIEDDPKPKTEKAGRDPRMDDWLEDRDNAWFHKDPELKGAMIKAHAKLIEDNPGVPQADLLEDAVAIVKRRHPDEFGERETREKPNPRRQGAPAVNGSTGNRRAPAGNGKTWADVPDRDKAVFLSQQKMFKGRGVEFTQAQFLEDYWS